MSFFLFHGMAEANIAMHHLHELSFIFLALQSPIIVARVHCLLLKQGGCFVLLRFDFQFDVVLIKNVLPRLREVLVKLHHLWEQFFL